MNKQTDLHAIKQIAKELLNIDILETEYSPIIVSHPFTKCGIVNLLDGDDFIQLDITKSKDALNRWKAQISHEIDESRDVYQVYYLLNDSYQLMFFNEISKLLSKDDFSNLLGEAWVNSEYANSDANVSKKEMLAHFKNADKSILMSEDEIETYNELDDSVVIYRGCSQKDRKNAKVLSWTTSFGRAKWFSERWDEKGVIYCTIVDKKDILAYFNRRNEDEVIVDYNKLQEIKIVNKPLKTTCPQNQPE